MNKFFFTLLGLLSLQIVFGQQATNNSQTDEHQQISGTSIFLIPPADFLPATNFSGFQEESISASILLVEIPASFDEATKGFSDERFKAQGVDVKKTEEIMVNGDPGLLLTAEQSAYGTTFSKYLLVFGDDQNTYMLNSSFPKELEEFKDKMLASLLSVVVDADLKADPLAAVPFSVDAEGTKLQFAISMTGMLLYTVDGKVPTASEDKTTFIVGPSLGAVLSINRKQTAISRLEQMPYSDLTYEEDQIEEVEIDGMSGYAIVAEGRSKAQGADTETKDLIYQVMLFHDEGYYLMLGTAKGEFEANLDLFKKVALTLKRK